MKEPKVSVVIPVYNCEKFLAKNLGSVCAQTLKDIEIICVNDGSVDGSIKILQNYAKKDKRIKVISQENQGQSVARNNALKIATGKYISFVDADDYINDCFLEELYKAAVNYNADITVGNIIRVEGGIQKGNVISYKKTKEAHETNDIFKLLNIPKSCYIVNRLYKREFIINNDFFFKQGVVYEDVIWSTLVAAKAKKVVSVPKADYYYVYNEKSTVNTTVENPKKVKDRYEAYMFYNRYVLEHKIKAKLRWKNTIKVTFLGLPLIKIKENPEYMKEYYFCGIKFATVKNKEDF